MPYCHAELKYLLFSRTIRLCLHVPDRQAKEILIGKSLIERELSAFFYGYLHCMCRSKIDMGGMQASAAGRDVAIFPDDYRKRLFQVFLKPCNCLGPLRHHIVVIVFAAGLYNKPVPYSHLH